MTHPTVLSHPSENDDPSVPLETHLSQVGTRAREVVPDGATTSAGDDLAEVAELLGRLHDFGKLTTFFQAHVRDEPTDRPTHHARLGAFVTYHALSQWGVSKSTRLAGTVAVWRHHGDLPNVAVGIAETLASENLCDAVSEQVGDICDHRSDLAGRILADVLDDGGSWDAFVERGVEDVRATIEDEVTYLDVVDDEDITAETYADMLQLSSALVLADKTRAGGLDDDRLEPEPLDLDDLTDHLETLGGDERNDHERALNGLRAEAQSEVVENVPQFLDADESVATVTLPTGYGKTLVGLRAALEIQRRRDTDGRIVYALPFTSIIDQTAETLREVFDADPLGRTLTVHHHLSETATLPERGGDDEDRADPDEPTDQHAREDVLVGESWRSGATLTTFVQLFESLAGPENAQSMKLPALYGSVVIVDEPQALPLYWWPLVERLVGLLTEVYDAQVVLMTATQPELVDEPFALIRERERYFDGELPDRVEYEFDASATARDDETVVGHEEAAVRLVDEAAGGTDSTLAVCNTIDSARELSEALEDHVGDDLLDVSDLYRRALRGSFGGIPTTEPRGSETVATRERARFVRRVADADADLALVHLTTRIRPCDRRALLDIASDLTGEDVPLVVVSTQLIEAGVDISFDRVYRDLAPLDSIVQAAGRCNRSYERRDRGTVTVWRLGPPGDREKPPSAAVYARVEKSTEQNLINATREALESAVEPRIPGDLDGATVPESVLTTHAVEAYHRLVGEGVEPDGNDPVNYYESAEAASLRKESLIDQVLSFEVYVCRTDAEHRLVSDLREARRERRFDEIDRLRSDLTELRVSVPVYRRDSEAARVLANIDPLFSLDRGTNWGDETERVLDRSASDTEFGKYFHPRDGVHLPESNVEARFF
ncbi:CRISPR-associated endonuclease Cas3'' [Halorussus salilacus]|uniref:CRISPR-associated endonuclease Cas3'' n=1 Tax=Halorussus salilacus TaxID=2953750 RepID=UPI0020A0456E|nr:CRISPR-associated endonuclease Cas3'' [Halorussus salilacus]USZ68378.1 CRISPR-associated endonuclease Cas3'' [Halorussus salilacus]